MFFVRIGVGDRNIGIFIILNGNFLCSEMAKIEDGMGKKVQWSSELSKKNNCSNNIIHYSSQMGISN